MNSYTVRDIQIRCAALGFDPGPIDGMMGPKTRAAQSAVLKERNTLFDPSGLHTVVWHWTAGAYGDIAMERKAYNAVVDQHGNVIDGDFRPEAQAWYAPGRAASHTYMANSHRIGISMDCMAGAKDYPFSWGSAPMTWGHVDGMLDQTAQWCREFDIPVSKWTTLSHAEVQPTLGIRQKWKWDIQILPDMKNIDDPVKVGDRLREMLKERL